MSSTMSCLRDRTQNCDDLRVFLFENVAFVKSVALIVISLVYIYIYYSITSLSP